MKSTTKIFGYDWQDIQRAQQGGRLNKVIDTNVRKERLFFSQAFNGQWMLKDSNGAFIGWFGSPALARQWCDDNGYNSSQG